MSWPARGTVQQLPEGETLEHFILMDRLKTLLLDFSAAELSAIGVTIKREEGEFAWLIEAMALALDRCAREKPAAQLRKDPTMEKGVTISVTRHFLIELAKLLDERASA